MTVCQYFLQGRCRFGQNCRNEHSYGNDDRSNRNPLNSQQLSTVVKKIAEVVILAEKGGQWPLSCFSPLKEGANIPGWEDYSPEEIRWKMYEARANGTLNQATLEISQLYSNAEKMRNMLKEPTVESVNIIANLLRGRNEPTSVSNPFKSISTSNIFGGSVQSSIPTATQNIFGVPSSPGSQGSIFGGSASNTGSQGSIFGGSASNTGSQGSIFGGSASNTGSQGSIFGGSSSNTGSQGSIFGGSASNTGSQGSIFGGSSQPTGTSFGSTGSFPNQSIFGNSMSSNAFSQASLSNSQNAASGGSGNIFSNPAISSQNIFSNSTELNNQSMQNAFIPQNSSGLFSNPTSTSIFDSKKSESLNQNQSFSFSSSQNSNIFMTQKPLGKADIFSSQPQATKSAFGSLGQQNAFNSSQQVLSELNLSIYSKVEDLNEEEIQSFTSATFEFGKIPLKPPPQKFCK